MDRYRHRWMHVFNSGNLKVNPFYCFFSLCEMVGPGSLHTWGERGRFKLAIWKWERELCRKIQKYSIVLLMIWLSRRPWIFSCNAKVCLCEIFSNSLSSLVVDVDNVARLEIQRLQRYWHENGRNATPENRSCLIMEEVKTTGIWKWREKMCSRSQWVRKLDR